MLRSIAGRLVKDGHEVIMLSEQPSYKASDGEHTLPAREEIDGIQVHRLPRLPLWGKSGLVKAISKLIFPLRAYFYCVRNFGKKTTIDLVWTATIPPVLSGAIGLRLAKRYSAKFLYHCQDLYPEIALHMGMVKPGSMIARLMDTAEKKTRAQADLLVSLSDDMESTVREMVGPLKNQRVLNNFLLDDFKKDKTKQTTSAQLFPAGDTTNIVFAGNIGNFQGLETITQVLVNLGEQGKHIHLTFMGEGKALAEIKTIAQNASNISFVGHMPFAKAQAMIAQADYGLVSLEPEIYKFAFPSKTLTYLGLSIPLVVVVEPESQLVQSIKSHEIGFYAEGGSEEQIAAMLQAITANAETKARHRDSATKYYEESCSREHVLDNWSDLIATKLS